MIEDRMRLIVCTSAKFSTEFRHESENNEGKCRIEVVQYVRTLRYVLYKYGTTYFSSLRGTVVLYTRYLYPGVLLYNRTVYVLRTHGNENSFSHMFGLPTELLRLVLLKLSAHELIQLAASCRMYEDLTNEVAKELCELKGVECKGLWCTKCTWRVQFQGRRFRRHGERVMRQIGSSGTRNSRKPRVFSKPVARMYSICCHCLVSQLHQDLADVHSAAGCRRCTFWWVCHRLQFREPLPVCHPAERWGDCHEVGYRWNALWNLFSPRESRHNSSQCAGPGREWRECERGCEPNGSNRTLPPLRG